MSGPVHGDPMMSVFPRMQCPREVYQLNLPGSREATADFLTNSLWSLCKFLEKIPQSLPAWGQQTTCAPEDEWCEEDVCS